jgi:hypothetical protein
LRPLLLDKCWQSLWFQDPHVAPRRALFDVPTREYDNAANLELLARRLLDQALQPPGRGRYLQYGIAVERTTGD